MLVSPLYLYAVGGLTCIAMWLGLWPNDDFLFRYKQALILALGESWFVLANKLRTNTNIVHRLQLLTNQFLPFINSNILGSSLPNYWILIAFDLSEMMILRMMFLLKEQLLSDKLCRCLTIATQCQVLLTMIGTPYWTMKRPAASVYPRQICYALTTKYLLLGKMGP